MPLELSKNSGSCTPRDRRPIPGLRRAKPRMDAIVKEVQEPNQGVGTTVTELRDLALSGHQGASTK